MSCWTRQQDGAEMSRSSCRVSSRRPSTGGVRADEAAEALGGVEDVIEFCHGGSLQGRFANHLC